MKTFKSTSIIFLVLMSMTAMGQTKEENIRKIMEVTGMAQMTQQIMDQMVAMQKQNNREVPNEFWDAFMAKVDTKELLDMMVPIYDKYYTEEDIVALLEFYNTPIGKKTISVTPALMQESMMAGQTWGMKLAEQIVAEMQKEGY